MNASRTPLSIGNVSVVDPFLGGAVVYWLALPLDMPEVGGSRRGPDGIIM